MPKQGLQIFHFQQADDFTVVSTDANKENFQVRNYQTLSQTIATKRLQQLRAIETVHSIFTLSFHLIETFFRPPSSLSNAAIDSSQTDGTHKGFPSQGKRKRRGKIEPRPQGDNCFPEGSTHGAFQMPRKRIHGLSGAYKAEYSTKMSLPGISQHFGNFYHGLIDWQLVFAPVTECSSNGSSCLAKELNYDSLFDFEDFEQAIATTANLLSNARQHSDLIDGLVLCAGYEGKSASTEYVRDQSNFGGLNDFCKLVGLVEQLIKQKKDGMEELRAKTNSSDNDSEHLLAGWFKYDKSTNSNQSPQECSKSKASNANQRIRDLQREVNAWEEFLDVVEISSKWSLFQLRHLSLWHSPPTEQNSRLNYCTLLG